MGTKGKIAITVAILGVIGSVLGVGSSSDWTFNWDQSVTNIGHIGDNTINQYFLDNFGVNLEKAKENCIAGVYEGMEAQVYCDLIT